MADRYYLCPIIGTGSEGNPFRAKIADANVTRVSAAISSGSDGKPTKRWTVCRVTAASFTEVEVMEGVTRLGTKATLDSALSLGQKDAIGEKLRDVGEDLDAKDTTARSLVTRLIKKHYPHAKDVLEAFP
jgi:hypothetical protein